MFVVVAPYAHAVARDDLLGRFYGIAVEFYVPCFDRSSSITASFEHAHGPHPCIDADRTAIWLRRGVHLVLVVVFVDDLLNLRPVVDATNDGDDEAENHKRETARHDEPQQCATTEATGNANHAIARVLADSLLLYFDGIIRPRLHSHGE